MGQQHHWLPSYELCFTHCQRFTHLVDLWRLRVPGAYLAALLFAVHPVNVESVAWISELKNVLSLFFALLSVLWFLNAEPDLVPTNQIKTSHSGPKGKKPSLIYRWYWLSVTAFTLAMLSKGSVAILPLLLLLIVWWRSDRISQSDCIRVAPYFLIAAVLTVVNIWFQTHGTGEAIRQAALLQRLLGAGAVPWFYLYKALWPVNLMFVYPQWNIDIENVLWWLPLIISVLVTGTLIWQRHRSWVRPLLVVWLFFCVALVPVMGLVDVYFMKYALVADHYQYIAIISVLAIGAAALISLTHQLPQWITIAVGAVPILCCGVLTWQETDIYRDPITLFQTTVDRNPNCVLAHNKLGLLLTAAGKTQDAYSHFERATALQPNRSNAHYSLALTLAKQGRKTEAIEQYRLAEQEDPDFLPTHFNLAQELRDDGQWQKAISEYQQAIRVSPGFVGSYTQLAGVLMQHGQLQEAIPYLQQAIRLQPNNVGAYSNLALAFAAMNQTTEATSAAQKAIELARSQGQTALAEQIEAWLAKYRPQPAN
jgi:protein O-mannosyl-transferase